MTFLQQLFAALSGSRPSPRSGRPRPARHRRNRRKPRSQQQRKTCSGTVHGHTFTGRTSNANSKRKKKSTRPRASAQPRSTQPSSKRNQRPKSSKTKHGSLTVYHGTSSAASAKGIIARGFYAGAGNLHGDGIYFSHDTATAKTYASGGVYLKVRLKPGRVCTMNPKLQAAYAAWCKRNGIAQDNSSVTSYLLQRGYQTLINGNIIVLLRPQMVNAAAYAKKDRRVKILGVYLASDDKRIRV